MKRGEIWWINFAPSIGFEIRKARPAVIVRNDTSNQFGKRVQAVPATSNTDQLYPPECYVQIKGKTSRMAASVFAWSTAKSFRENLDETRPGALNSFRTVRSILFRGRMSVPIGSLVQSQLRKLGAFARTKS
jgi:mRNA-degrading endonuclease toxin of MazEF toxin-antitoxin module